MKPSLSSCLLFSSRHGFTWPCEQHGEATPSLQPHHWAPNTPPQSCYICIIAFHVEVQHRQHLHGGPQRTARGCNRTVLAPSLLLYSNVTFITLFVVLELRLCSVFFLSNSSSSVYSLFPRKDKCLTGRGRFSIQFVKSPYISVSIKGNSRRGRYASVRLSMDLLMQGAMGERLCW